jgi:hypothetical protein
MRYFFLARLPVVLVLATALAICSVGPPLIAEDPPAGKKDEKSSDIAPPTAKELADKKMMFMKTALSHFTIQVGDNKEQAKVLDPCLRWNNPISTAADGIVAVYAQNGGRPAALGQFFFNFQKKWVNEFTIIPDGDVTIMRSGKEFWKPSEFVCKFTDLPRSPIPADKPALRLPQMRAIAADFSVVDHFGAVNIVKQDLRLLTQPVYRYSEAGKIVDGALFIFVLGTDPECCVLVEAYQDDKGSRYRYAVAPMSIYQLEVSYKDNLVWSIERRVPAASKSRAYYAAAYTLEPGETLPE